MSENTQTDGYPLSGEQSENSSNWKRLILEFQQEENDKNPLPPVSGPIIRDRQEFVPEDIEKYLQHRYGPDVLVRVGNRFGNEDGSGYSYLVYQGKGEEMVRLAEMSAERMSITMLPPEYKGSLQEELQKVIDRNKRLSKDSRPEELRRTLWVIDESSRAQKMHEAQLEFHKNLKFEPLNPTM